MTVTYFRSNTLTGIRTPLWRTPLHPDVRLRREGPFGRAAQGGSDILSRLIRLVSRHTRPPITRFFRRPRSGPGADAPWGHEQDNHSTAPAAGPTP
jgi:hypothetical protein